MTLAAVSRNVERLWFSKIALANVVSSFGCGRRWIAAVTVVAHQAARFVNVIVEQLGGRADARIVEPGVTFDAGVFLLSGDCGRAQGEDEEQ